MCTGKLSVNVALSRTVQKVNLSISRSCLNW